MKKLFLILISTLTLLVSASIFVSADTVSGTLDFTNVGTGAGQTAASGDGYSWKDNTLTINNLTLNVPADAENDTCGIILPAGSTLVVKGSNSITLGAAGKYSYGIKAAGKLTIKNSGTLTVKAGDVSSQYCASYGIYAEGNLSCSSCKLNIESGLANSAKKGTASCGAFVLGNATFSGGKYSFKSADSCSRSVGLKVNGALALKNAAELTSYSGNTSDDYQYSCGVYAETGIDIAAGCRMEAYCGNTSGKAADAIAVLTDAKNSYIKTFGTIIASSGKASGDGGTAYALSTVKGITTAGNCQIKNVKGTFTNGKTKTLTQKGSNAVEILSSDGPLFDLGNGQYGMDSSDHSWAGYDFAGWYDNPEYSGSAITSGFENGRVYYAKWTLNGAEVLVNPIDFTVKAAPASGSGFTWDVATQTLTLNNFQMKIASQFEDDTYGVNLPDGATIVLTDGSSNTIKSSNAAGCTYAVFCNGSLTITGNGSLKATAGNGDVKAYGIYTAGRLTSSGNIVAKAGKGISGKAKYANGINCKGAIDVTGGSIKAYGGYAESEANGIWASSALSISNGASVELFCNEKLGIKSLTLDVTKLVIEEGSKLNVKGKISCGKYGGEYYLNGAKVSRVKTSGNEEILPSGSNPIRIRNFKALKKNLIMKVKAGTNSQIPSWNKIEDADGYELYFASIGETPEKIATFDKSISSFQLTRLSNTGKYTLYLKAFVKDENGITYTQTSPTIFTAGRSADRSNAASISVKKKSATLFEGDTLALGAKVSKKSSSKTLLYKGYCKQLRYITTDNKVATVSDKGIITAKGPGQCYIYVVAPNGLSKEIKITVF